MKPNKYRAKPTEVNGIRFASKREGARYSELRLMERAGEIENLELQPRFDFIVNGHKIAFYKADFQYVRLSDGVPIIEDVKGVETPTFRLKRKLLRALHGRDITIVK